MTAKHTERAFEDAIEAHLIGPAGWKKGSPQAFDRGLALLPDDIIGYVADTQPQLWSDLQKQHGKGTREAVIDALVKTLATRGTLEVLRHGFKVLGKKVEFATFRPAHGLNPDILARYAQNRLVVLRQLRFIPGEDASVDLGFFLNGLPVATVELKSPLTHQTVEHAIAQYKSRDAKHPLFQFKKRALVHFAVDPDLAYMTTKLEGEATVFLPFNRGNGTAAGNPEHPSGYRTAYLWEEVWQRDSFLDILGRFVHLAVEEKEVEGKKVRKETVIFPRYHQLDAVRNLEAAARRDGTGKSYLIQHSAGSGKSNSIAWLAHRLATLHADDDKKVFDAVVVVTDRRVLDKQLQDNIYQIEHKNGVVAKIEKSSEQLAKALSAGAPIIITTLQKFPFVTEKIGRLPGRAYAVIVDEAHSSQSGEAARSMKEVLAARNLTEAEDQDAAGEEDVEDRITQVMLSRGRQANLSFFAFTATPKYKTLEVFGQRDAEGNPRPFHLYSMRQAIEEGFILDVLRSYTTYKAFYRLVKATEGDPRVNKKQAASQLARFMSLHPHNIAQKTQVMVEHFRAKVRHAIGGKAKAMVVTSSRLHAVRYKQAFERYIAEQGYSDIGVLVAFSGTVKDPEDDREYTEVGMNRGIREQALPESFATDRFQLLLVASKYQTGFDQPLLHTMYVDKRLSGVQAVQTLSRLNRTAPGKEDTFILDFVNDAEEIQRSFRPYYEQTTVAETAEPQQLYDLQHRLESAQVFWGSEVEAFCKVFYAPKAKQTATDQAEMHRHLNPAIDRFKALDEDAQDDFRSALKAFVRLYSFLSQIMPFTDSDLEKLYAFGRFLELKLPHDPRKAPLDLKGEVALRYYRLSRVSEGSIALEVREQQISLYGPTEVGTRKAEEEDGRLSEVIDILNERFGTEFTRADQLFFDQAMEETKADDTIRQQARANSFDNFALAAEGRLLDAFIERMESNGELVKRMMNEPEFQKVALEAMLRRMYDELRSDVAPPASGKAPTIRHADEEPPSKASKVGQRSGAPRERFEALVDQWRRETGGWSNPHKIIAHRCYRAIVEMGWDVVPLILADLEQNPDPDFWGPALREITGEEVTIAPDDVGRLDVIARAWLSLAKRRGWGTESTTGDE